MKKAAIIIMSALMLSAICVFAAGNVNDDEEAQQAAKVAEAIENKTFEIWVSTIVPQGAPSIPSSREYSIQVVDGVANGRLPFFGTSYTSVFGSDDSSVVLEDIPVTITTKTKGLKKKPIYVIRFKTKGMTRWEGIINVWDNGSADISCTSSTKSPMTYYGEMDPDFKPSEEEK